MPLTKGPRAKVRNAAVPATRKTPDSGNTGRNRVSREIRNEQADEQGNTRTTYQELRHGDWTARKHG